MSLRVGLAVGATLMVSLVREPLANPELDTLDESSCPASVRGVAMAVTKVRGGVMLEFTAPDPQQRPELLLVIREAAAYVEYHSKLASLRATEQSTEAGVYIPPVDVAVRPRAKGAQVTIRPDEAQHADVVVILAKTLKQRWDSNACVGSKVARRLPLKGVRA